MYQRMITMELEKQKKSICSFFIIFVLFLGMCFEKTQADSFFSFSSFSHDTTAVICSIPKTASIDTIYHENTLTEQDCSLEYQQLLRRFFSRAGKNIALILTFVDTLPQIFPTIKASSDCELTNESSSSTVIVNYIHHKDGKKA